MPAAYNMPPIINQLSVHSPVCPAAVRFFGHHNMAAPYAPVAITLMFQRYRKAIQVNIVSSNNILLTRAVSDYHWLYGLFQTAPVFRLDLSGWCLRGKSKGESAGRPRVLGGVDASLKPRLATIWSMLVSCFASSWHMSPDDRRCWQGARRAHTRLHRHRRLISRSVCASILVSKKMRYVDLQTNKDHAAEIYKGAIGVKPPRMQDVRRSD